MTSELIKKQSNVVYFNQRLGAAQALFRPAFGVHSTQTLVEIYNSQTRLNPTFLGQRHLHSVLETNKHSPGHSPACTILNREHREKIKQRVGGGGLGRVVAGSEIYLCVQKRCKENKNQVNRDC